MPAPKRSERTFMLILVICASVLLGVVLSPLASALFMAAVLAGVLHPLHRRLTRLVGKHANVSAGAIVFTVVVVLVGPIAGLSAFLANEAADGVAFVQKTVASEGVAGLIGRLPGPVQKLANEAIKRLPKGDGDRGGSVEKQIEAQGGKAAAALGAALSATGAFFFQATMMLIAVFFLLVEGEAFVSWLDDVSPLRPGQTRELLSESRKVSYAVIVSSVITSAVQAAAALVGYLIARVPNPVFFAAVTFFVAFIPAIGAASVCIVAALLLYVTGHPYMAIFLAAWGVTVVALVDNIVKPFLIKGGIQMHGAVVFFALIGGIAVFGAIGLLAGPLIVAFFLALLRMYRRDFAAVADPS